MRIYISFATICILLVSGLLLVYTKNSNLKQEKDFFLSDIDFSSGDDYELVLQSGSYWLHTIDKIYRISDEKKLEKIKYKFYLSYAFRAYEDNNCLSEGLKVELFKNGEIIKSTDLETQLFSGIKESDLN